jgi:tetratricopeptide (TPR) repeat protein
MATDFDRRDSELLARLMRLMQQGRLPEAEDAARHALRSAPRLGILWKILGVVRVQQGKEALPELTRAAELLPNDAEAQGNLGSALHARGDWWAAIPHLESALRLAPHDAGALRELADCLRATGRAREALSWYRGSLAIDPQCAEAHNNLGNALLECGERARAIECYQRALALRPNDAHILGNLSNGLRQAGRLEDALAAARYAVGQSPRDAEAHQGLGNVLRDLGELKEALAFYRRAVELEPNRAERYCSLGNALFEARKIDEALVQYRLALALRPDYAAAHVGLALVFRQRQQPREAQAAAQAALASDPGFAEALSLSGELAADDGQFATAHDHFRRALDLKPGLVAAMAGIATHRRMTAEDADWLQQAKTLLMGRLPVAEEISLRFAMGKYFDDIGEFGRAFAEYHRANELCKQHGPAYDPKTVTRRIDAIIERFGSAPPPPVRAGEWDSELPILIIGMPRSGTSLAEQILASHPDVVGGGELVFWSSAYEAYQDAQTRGDPVEDLIPGFAADYLDRLRSMSRDAVRIVDKMPVNFLYAGLVHCALPRARIIHLRRHPIDTCLSIYFQNFFNLGPYANDLAALVHYYGEYSRVTQCWRTRLPAAVLLEVPYEGLVNDPELWTRRMLDFAGLPWDPRCLEFHRAERAVITASRWQVRQEIHTRSTGRWRNYESHVSPLKGLLADWPDAEPGHPAIYARDSQDPAAPALAAPGSSSPRR